MTYCRFCQRKPTPFVILSFTDLGVLRAHNAGKQEQDTEASDRAARGRILPCLTLPCSLLRAYAN